MEPERLEPISGPPSAHLRDSLERVRSARDGLERVAGPAVAAREVIVRELGRAELSILRALHLIGG